MANNVLAQLPAPKNLKAEFDTTSREIILRWDSLAEQAAGFHLFVKGPDQTKYFLSGQTGPIYASKVKYQVNSPAGGEYNFKVAAFNNFPKVEYGVLSESLQVIVPTSFLPMVANLTTKVKRESAQLSWTFNLDSFDLKGFIIKINEDEILVGHEIRDYRFENLKSGAYSASITAVSNYGIKGESSKMIVFRIK